MNLKATLFFALLGGMSSQTLGAAVDRVDPPNWWVGMADSSLQLMMYGNEIGSGSLASKSGDVTISQVTSGDSPNYLFVDLTIHAERSHKRLSFYIPPQMGPPQRCLTLCMRGVKTRVIDKDSLQGMPSI